MTSATISQQISELFEEDLKEFIQKYRLCAVKTAKFGVLNFSDIFLELEILDLEGAKAAFLDKEECRRWFLEKKHMPIGIADKLSTALRKEEGFDVSHASILDRSTSFRSDHCSSSYTGQCFLFEQQPDFPKLARFSFLLFNAHQA